jgi:hypothetical protein
MSFETLEGSAREVNVEPLSNTDKDKINKLIYQHVFGNFENEEQGASTATALAHQIVTDGTAVCCKPCRLSMAQRWGAEEEIDNVHSPGVIRASKSGYASIQT